MRVQERAFHLLGGGDEPLTRAGELGSGRPPVEQLGADRLFKRRNAAADRGMVELEPLGGGDELATTRDSEKNPDVIPIHEELGAQLDEGGFGRGKGPSSASARSS